MRNDVPIHATVAVVGGGPAGSTVSAILARQGFDVVLLERERFPRYHIGESLLPSVLTIAELTGAKSALEEHGFVKKPGAYLEWGMERWSLIFGELAGIPAHSYQVVRSEFDHILLNNAEKAGATIMQECRVDDIHFTSGRPSSLTYSALSDGSKRTLSFDQIVDCSGRFGVLSRKVGNERHSHDVFKNIALWSYWRNADLSGAGQSGSIRVLSIEAGWIWLIPLHDGTVSVGVVMHKDYFKSRREAESKEEIYQSVLRAHETAHAALKGGTCGAVKFESDYSYTSDHFSGPGYYIAGDAACFLDPLLSSGVHLATFSGLVAAAAITSKLRNEVSEKEAIAYYEKSYRQAYLRFLVFVSAFYDQARGQKGYFWEAQKLTRNSAANTDLKSAFISLVSGIEDYDDSFRSTDEIVASAIANRVRENIELRKDKSAVDPGNEAAKENSEFFEAVEGLFVLSEKAAIDGLYVATTPEVHLARANEVRVHVPSQQQVERTT